MMKRLQVETIDASLGAGGTFVFSPGNIAIMYVGKTKEECGKFAMDLYKALAEDLNKIRHFDAALRPYN